MSSNVQSIICCLGDPVAGNPTQFLMQRAAASMAIDWMFVTAEVPESKISEAFHGIRALRFSGVAFLPPHRSIGCKLVDSLTEAALRSGHVRVARRDGDLWLGDDTLGAAIVELIQPQRSLPVSEQGAQPGEILVSGRSYLVHLVRLAAPASWSNHLREVTEAKIESLGPSEGRANFTNEIPPSATSTNSSNAESISDSASVTTVAFEDLIKNETPIQTLVIDSTSPALPQKQIAKLKWTTSPSVIFVEAHSRWESAITASAIPNMRLHRPLDIAAAKAVVNFHFWTGHHTDLVAIRESLDEYCQW